MSEADNNTRKVLEDIKAEFDEYKRLRRELGLPETDLIDIDYMKKNMEIFSVTASSEYGYDV